MLRGLFKLRGAARRGAAEIPEFALSAPVRNGTTRAPSAAPALREGSTRSLPRKGWEHLNRRDLDGEEMMNLHSMGDAAGHRRLDYGEGRLGSRPNPPPRSPRPPPPSAAPAQNWTRPGLDAPGAWSWDPSQRGQMVHVPLPTPINKVASTNAPIKPQWSAWGAVPATMMAGGMTANLFSSEENRGLGTFAKGALFGAGGGLGMHMAMGSGALGRATAAARAMAVKGGHKTAASWAGSAHQMARMAQSQESRAVAWGAGAMLAGTLGGSSRSKAHGINANRGNRFGG